jgi:hypothetical protein
MGQVILYEGAESNQEMISHRESDPTG